jgi:hypothetical protein
MSAFEICQFLDDFALPLVELEMLIRILLRPFTMLSDGLWYQKRLHFPVDFAEFSVKLSDPLDSFHCEHH